MHLFSYRKAQGPPLPYAHPSARRPQYITVQQLAALQQAVQQQVARQEQKQQPLATYETLVGVPKANARNLYRPAASIQQHRPVQYASSSIVDAAPG